MRDSKRSTALLTFSQPSISIFADPFIAYRQEERKSQHRHSSKKLFTVVPIFAKSRYNLSPLFCRPIVFALLGLA
jgi:hypothetical protein